MNEAKAYLFELLNQPITTDEYTNALALWRTARDSILDYRSEGFVPFDVRMGVITARILVNEARNRHISNVLVERFGTDGALVMNAYENGDYDEELENASDTN